MRSSLERSMIEWRKLGYTVDKVEHKVGPPNNPRLCKTRDLFNCIDAVGVKAGEKVIGLQSTSWACIKKHIDKYSDGDINQKLMKDWLSTGHTRFILEGFKKSKGFWVFKRVEATLHKGILSWQELDK